MEHNNNDINYVEYTKIGSFVYALEGENGNDFFEKIDRSKFSSYAILDKSLDGIEAFYVFMEDYSYNIVINKIKGHNIILKKSEIDHFIDVYSTNYKEVMEQKNIQKVKKR